MTPSIFKYSDVNRRLFSSPFPPLSLVVRTRRAMRACSELAKRTIMYLLPPTSQKSPITGLKDSLVYVSTHTVICYHLYPCHFDVYVTCEFLLYFTQFTVSTFNTLRSERRTWEECLSVARTDVVWEIQEGDSGKVIKVAVSDEENGRAWQRVVREWVVSEVRKEWVKSE